MTKLRALLLFVPLAMLAAGAFGAIHDQISYTVSHEYFTKFKFLQFRMLDASVPERVRAAQVGFLASWWMGVPLGLLAGAAGFRQRSAHQMWHALLWSLPVIMASTLLVALGGLAYGFFRTRTVDLAAYAVWYIPKNLTDPQAFLRAGYMHNAAYLGGLLAVPLAWLFHLWFRRRSATASCRRAHTLEGPVAADLVPKTE